MSPFELAFRALSPSGPNARLTVMIFHRVLPSVDPVLPDTPDAAEFEAMMNRIKSWFNVLPLEEAINRLELGRLPARPLALTFDDGYADNYTVALPILQRVGLHATFFVAPGFLDGGRMWNDMVIDAVRAARTTTLDLSSLQLGMYPIATSDARCATIERLLDQLKYLDGARRAASATAIAALVDGPVSNDLMMTSEQVAQLHRAGMAIGAHTLTHPILGAITPAQARHEIAQSRRALEDITGAPVRLFAYPNGIPGRDYTHEHVGMVRELGFDGAVSTAWGVSSAGCDRFQIPRFTPWDRAPWKYGLRLLQNLLRGAPRLA